MCYKVTLNTVQPYEAKKKLKWLLQGFPWLSCACPPPTTPLPERGVTVLRSVSSEIPWTPGVLIHLRNTFTLWRCFLKAPDPDVATSVRKHCSLMSRFISEAPRGEVFDLLFSPDL